ncbi:expressed unknown protein [Seminavis robusta]|uniref:Uncharacterized protein n=1 Tax=Seminavis robusta TaxID=568900 RepID=A0A9N8H5A7_9STRA|nr:expressed unknown protein [Seminavis robusta]|eukprot:Sro138_g064691.1  (116) ;mRNA; f:37535-37882
MIGPTETLSNFYLRCSIQQCSHTHYRLVEMIRIGTMFPPSPRYLWKAINSGVPRAKTWWWLLWWLWWGSCLDMLVAPFDKGSQLQANDKQGTDLSCIRMCPKESTPWRTIRSSSA